MKKADVSVTPSRLSVKVSSQMIINKLVAFFNSVDPGSERLETFKGWARKVGEEKINEMLREQYGVDLETFAAVKDGLSAMATGERKMKKGPHFSAYLSHAWGKDAEGRDNHQRVASVNEKLKAEGLQTWFDSEKMKGNVTKQMSDGIDQSTTVVVFVTRKYMDKLNGTKDDNCKREFQYAVRRKTTSNMITVVMEKGMLDTTHWIGPLGFELGGSLYIDMSTKEKMMENFPILAQEIQSREEATNRKKG